MLFSLPAWGGFFKALAWQKNGISFISFPDMKKE